MFASRQTTAETPPAAETPEADPLSVAERHYSELRAGETALRQQIADMRLAVRMVNTRANPEAHGEPPAELAARAQPYLNRASRRPEKFAQEIADLEDEIVAGEPALRRAREVREAERRRRTDRIAVELQGRHRAIVGRIAAALEDLSRAVADELAIHEELAKRAPLRESAHLPHLGAPLLDAALYHPHSTAWRWAGDCRRLGIFRSDR